MTRPFYLGVGGVVSADIAVPEHEREVAFYSKVLTTGEHPLWRDDLMNNQGTPIIGLGQRVPEYESLPLQWTPHFQVADIAASAARAVELGGKELFHGKDDDGNSLWAALVDPAGGAFGIIPVVDEEAYAVPDLSDVGCIAGLALVAADVGAMSAFYEQVIGLESSSIDGDGRCELRRPDGSAAAEICPAADGLPSAWILSLPVRDFDASLRHVRDGCGVVVREDAGARTAVIQDPVGVFIGLQG